MKTLIFIILLLPLAACIKTADNVKLPKDAGSKLVIGCFIAPQDSIISATVTKSHSPYGFQNTSSLQPIVTNASVVISTSEKSIGLIYDPELEVYYAAASQLPLVPGKSYSIRVSAPGFTAATASATIPFNLNTSLEYQLDSVTDNSSAFGNNQFKLVMKWKDQAFEKNFYHIGLEMLYAIKTPFDVDTVFSTESFTVISDDESISGNFLLTDDYYQPFQGTTNMGEKNIFLYTTDANYYNYYRWLNNPGGDDPFTEPRITFTNVQNGLGVFAGYQKHKVKIQ